MIISDIKIKKKIENCCRNNERKKNEFCFSINMIEEREMNDLDNKYMILG
jgi:hypothetical protein